MDVENMRKLQKRWKNPIKVVNIEYRIHYYFDLINTIFSFFLSLHLKSPKFKHAVACF